MCKIDAYCVEHFLLWVLTKAEPIDFATKQLTEKTNTFDFHESGQTGFNILDFYENFLNAFKGRDRPGTL